MIDLLRMDLYRMRKNKSFWVCLIFTLVLSAAEQPFMKLLFDLVGRLQEEVNAGVSSTFPAMRSLSEIVSDPFPILNALFVMLSAASFLYADSENGYIKNIAGQMPKKGYTILSKFLAIIAHNLLFLLVCVAGNALGTLSVQSIIVDDALTKAIGVFFLKLLLLQGLCAVLLLADAALQNKALGTVFAVLLGIGLLSLIYAVIDTLLNQVFPKKSFSIADYMPDQILRQGMNSLKTVRALIVSGVTIGIFLPLSIRIFDRKDVK